MTNVSSGGGNDDGDGIGRDGTTITIFFSLGGVPLPPLTGVVGTYIDNTERKLDELDPAIVSPLTGHADRTSGPRARSAFAGN